MTIDPNCWVELSGVSPAAQTRGPRVTTGPENKPKDTVKRHRGRHPRQHRHRIVLRLRRRHG